jgi:putative peptidoglycan lipid II flippase
VAPSADTEGLRAREAANTAAVVRSAGIVSVAVLMSRVTGLVREVLMARLFGAGMAYDAFLLGFRIPNLTRDLFAEGALSSAFVPAFVQHLATKGKQEAGQLANLVATSIILLVGGLCLVGVLLSPLLVHVLAPGFESVPGKFDMAVTMTRIMFPFLLLVALAAQVLGMLNACDRFGVPAMASTMFNVGSLGSGLALGFWAGPNLGITPIEGMAWGVVFGGALQLVWQMPSLHRAGFRFRPAFDTTHPGLRQIYRLMGPAILGSAAVQINVMVNTNFASRLQDALRGSDGPVSWLGYAFRFMQLPLGLFGVAIASATLPAISRSVASGEMDDFRRTLSRSMGLVFLLTIPSSAGLVLLGNSMIGAIYEWGRFDAYDTRQTGVALACYALGLAGYSALKVLTPAFYSLNDARTPMVVSLLSILVNLLLVMSLIGAAGFGHSGLALSTSLVAIFNFLVLFLIMRNKAGGIYGRNLTASVLKVALASLLMGVAVYFSNREILTALGRNKTGYMVDLAVSIPLGLLVYYYCCRMMKVAELDMAISAVAGPLVRLRDKIRL